MRRCLKASLGYQQNENEAQQLSIMDQQKDLLYHFNVLLKQKLKCKSLVELLISFDTILGQQFLPKNSFTSFVFENENGQWFNITKNRERFRFNKLGMGPWQRMEEVFQKEHRYKVESNIYFYDMSQQFEDEFDLQLAVQIKKLKEIMLILPTPTPTTNSVQNKPQKLSEIASRKADVVEYLLFSIYPMKVGKSETQTQFQETSGVKRFI